MGRLGSDLGAAVTARPGAAVTQAAALALLLLTLGGRMLVLTVGVVLLSSLWVLPLPLCRAPQLLAADAQQPALTETAF